MKRCISRASLRESTGFLLAFLLLAFWAPVAFAEGLGDLETEPVTDDGKREQYAEWLDFRAAELPEEIRDRIASFDINEDGLILLALEGNQLVVLDEQGEAIRRFTFSENGSYYAQWAGEHILLYDVRGDMLFELSLDGDCVSVHKVKQSNNNSGILHGVKTATEIQRNSAVYRVYKESGIVGFLKGYSYNRLCKVAPDGTEEEIVTVSEKASHKIVTTFLPISFAVLIPLVIIVGGAIFPKVIRSSIR